MHFTDYQHGVIRALFAALAPVLIGKIFDATGSWTVPFIVMIAVSAATLVTGWLSDLDRMVETD